MSHRLTFRKNWLMLNVLSCDYYFWSSGTCKYSTSLQQLYHSIFRWNQLFQMHKLYYFWWMTKHPQGTRNWKKYKNIMSICAINREHELNANKLRFKKNINQKKKLLIKCYLLGIFFGRKNSNSKSNITILMS